LVLFETSAGFALFKVISEGKLREATNIQNEFETLEKAHKIVQLQNFGRFKDTNEALVAATSIVESKLGESLSKFLTSNIVDKKLKETLVVSESKLGSLIQEQLGIKCLHDSSTDELMRGIRSQLENLVDVDSKDFKAMQLGLSHSLSRYKLKFSVDKVDTMIIQAIALLDDLEKELNVYSMRAREWYGWHFPELSKIIPDNVLFAKTVLKMGSRDKAANTDFSEFLPENYEHDLKDAAQISMGTEVSESDILNIKDLCEQIVSISSYRSELGEYLRNRMQVVAPNLTMMVGELVGARLIAHAGSLMNLAKHPSSTVQILGAEKALFRALKTKHDTPKYGLIYHASLVGQTAPKHKGKISRVLASRTSLAVRYDALGEGETSTSIGEIGRQKVEQRIQLLEGGTKHKIYSTGKSPKNKEKYIPPQKQNSYSSNSDVTNKIEIKSEKNEKNEKKDKKEKKQKKQKKQKTEETHEQPVEEVKQQEEQIQPQTQQQQQPQQGKKEKKDKKKDKKRKREEQTESSKKKKTEQ